MRPMSMDTLGWSRHHRNFPGQGALDVAGFLRAVHASGYAGPLSLEVFNDEFRAAPARLTARDAFRSLALIEAEAGITSLPRRPASTGSSSWSSRSTRRPRCNSPLFSPSSASTMPERTAPRRSSCIGAGRVNFVLNREQDSAAFEHFLLHGASVCAIGLRIDDAAAALSRAEALECPPWSGPIGEGERRIPAVRAPDGMLIHLVQPNSSGRTIWEDDFALGAAAAESAPMTIDHVAEALPAGRMDSAVLFWRAVFGFTAAPLVEIPDPFGMVSSRAMVSPDGSVRLPLNVSESRQTATGRFVSAFGGAGIQHVALVTPDAASVVDALAARHTRLLRIPDNYYDDIAARWGLDDPTIETLRRLHLLYDRDAGGEFIHAYTGPFQDRFFFEFVERRGSEGFGANNAGIRMAAQAAFSANPAGPAGAGAAAAFVRKTTRWCGG